MSYPGGAIGNLGGMYPIPGTTGIVPDIARGGSPGKEEKGYDEGWPPKAPQKPKVAAAQGGEGLSFQNLLGGSNLQGAIMNDPSSFQTAQVGSTDAERRQVLQEIINTPGYDPDSVREAQRQWLRMERGLSPFPGV
tara:strand:- start:151 stop:558 length:408 start_codon:yes stop_codon:yes gene_type:complete